MCFGIFYVVFGIINLNTDWLGTHDTRIGTCQIVAGSISAFAGLAGMCFGKTKVCLGVSLVLGALGGALWTYVLVLQSMFASQVCALSQPRKTTRVPRCASRR